jgi:uncharacterized protein (TIGR03435 family)
VHCLIVALCLSFTAEAQPPVFEAASVKPAAPTTSRGGSASSSGDRVTFANTTLVNVLTRAYALRAFQVDGPSWIRTERYDIVAKAPDNTPRERILQMLQTLLSERFHLKLHREHRDMPVYLLLSGKGAPKFQKSEGALTYDMSNGRRELKNHTLAQLADFVSMIVQRPVLDRTSLSAGTYNFPLETSMEELGGVNANPDFPVPSIFTIVEGLGLKLESRKEPVEVIVVDSGNKVPTEN